MHNDGRGVSMGFELDYRRRSLMEREKFLHTEVKVETLANSILRP